MCRVHMLPQGCDLAQALAMLSCASTSARLRGFEQAGDGAHEGGGLLEPGEMAGIGQDDLQGAARAKGIGGAAGVSGGEQGIERAAHDNGGSAQGAGWPAKVGGGQAL